MSRMEVFKMDSDKEAPEKATISAKDILEHPELYEKVAAWTNEVRGEFRLTYKKKEH
jgi:hypothetical protein